MALVASSRMVSLANHGTTHHHRQWKISGKIAVNGCQRGVIWKNRHWLSIRWKFGRFDIYWIFMWKCFVIGWTGCGALKRTKSSGKKLCFNVKKYFFFLSSRSNKRIKKTSFIWQKISLIFESIFLFQSTRFSKNYLITSFLDRTSVSYGYCHKCFFLVFSFVSNFHIIIFILVRTAKFKSSNVCLRINVKTLVESEFQWRISQCIKYHF